MCFWIIHHIYAYITPPTLVYIPDTNRDTLIKELNKQGVPLNMLDYRLFKRYPHPKEGWIRFLDDQKFMREKFIESLSVKKREPTRRIVMYSSDTIKEFVDRTSLQTNLSPAKLTTQYHKYSTYSEGGIVAGFYQIPYDTIPSAIMYYMVTKSEKKFQAFAEKHLGKYSYQEWKRILIIASIIQKETSKIKEMALVSSVIQNRLDKNIKLQMDATLNYGKYSHIPITPKRIKEDKSHYNTYLHKGLPKEPIGSATKDAILAALEPAETNYLYFMLNSNNEHDFSVTYKEHLENIKRYKIYNSKKNKGFVPIGAKALSL
ncbi:MAG TPA: endolytic transglycosylase MltG [Sulfurovum sp.]|nr:endolytic transglycosylase MltG [Sulfurovum sp.]